MDFALSDDQTLLRNTLTRFLGDHYQFNARTSTSPTLRGWSADKWQAFAELGILGVSFPESLGGSGGGAIENMIVMEEIGRHLVSEPYLATAIVGGGILRHAGGARAQEVIKSIVAGNSVLAVAHSNAHLAGTRTHGAVSARRRNGCYVLTGTKSRVRAAPGATHFLVTAGLSDGVENGNPTSLFLVDSDAPGVTLETYATYDGRRAAELRLNEVSLPGESLIGEYGEAGPLVARVVDEAIVAICAEGVGLQRKMLEDTVRYTLDRRQFGQPLANFQVLRHRLADMYVQLEQSAAITTMATLKLDESPVERGCAASAAKVQVSRACRFIGQSAIQLHGGCGLTEEVAVAHYFKRATMIESEFGTVNEHLERYERLTVREGVYAA